MQIASTGHSKVMVGIRSRTTLNGLRPDMTELSRISGIIKCNGYFVFTIDKGPMTIRTHGRMFAPAIGIPEDPVTGNANGPMGAYLVSNNIVDHNGSVFEFMAEQGEALGRAGKMLVRVGMEDSRISSVEITGEAVTVFRTEIIL